MQGDGWDVCRCYCGITGQAVTDGGAGQKTACTSLVVYIDFCYNMQVRNC